MIKNTLKIWLLFNFTICSLVANDKLVHELFLDNTTDNMKSLKRDIDEDIDLMLEYLKNSKELIDMKMLENKGDFDSDKLKHIENYNKLKKSIIKSLNFYEVE